MSTETVDIADARGELFAYRVEVVRARPLRVRLTRKDTGAVHEVGDVGSGCYRCSCEDSTFRGWRRRPPAVCCKHVVAVSEWAAAHEETSMSTELTEAPQRLPAGLTLPAPGGALPPIVLALLTGQRPALAKALVKAVGACRAVGHDSRNQYHGYDYASSEAVIDEGRRALSAAGLSLLPVEHALVGSEREGPDRFELVRTFLLLHESGECSPLRTTWPVVPDKGRPLDKATAAADTLSLAYLLRDLLLMPRVDQADDVAARDDRGAAPPPAKAAARKTAAARPAGPKADPEQLAEIDDALAARGTPLEKFTAAIRRKYGVESHHDLTRDQAAEILDAYARDAVAPKPARKTARKTA